MLLGFIDEAAGADDLFVVGHSAGAHFAQGVAARWPDRVAGLALVCPLLPGARDVPRHRAVIAEDELGTEEFRGYFVVQTPAMLDRYERFVAPAVSLVDQAAMERIGARWELDGVDGVDGAAYGGARLSSRGARVPSSGGRQPWTCSTATRERPWGCWTQLVTRCPTSSPAS